MASMSVVGDLPDLVVARRSSVNPLSNLAKGSDEVIDE
jgi:hypothetical protein